MHEKRKIDEQLESLKYQSHVIMQKIPELAETSRRIKEDEQKERDQRLRL